MDEELKKELSRQAAAHNNHLAKMLKLQQEELESLYEKYLINLFSIFFLFLLIDYFHTENC